MSRLTLCSNGLQPVAESSKAGSKRPRGEDVEAPKAAKIAKASDAAGVKDKAVEKKHREEKGEGPVLRSGRGLVLCYRFANARISGTKEF